MNIRPKILIVDDEPFNVDYLEQELEDLDFDTLSAANGQAALAQVAAESPDLVLLDIMMPIMDGFEVLARLKADPATRDIPVIVISAMSDLRSVVLGIKQGAEDYLPKPFDPVLLQARISASLDKKRFRDQEIEYLRQVERLTSAAAAVEDSRFEPDSLSAVAARPDALGNLARVFQRMAHEVHAREQRLKRQLHQLQLDIEERQKAAAETLAVYIPMDRRQVLAHGGTLPERTQGAALGADVSGFTALTEALAKELGLQRGAEELIRQLNRVFGALIDEVHRYGGSVINFSGDAIVCWFDSDDGLRATVCALAMQEAMRPFATVATPAGATVSFAIKVAVSAGSARRFLVGDPRIQHVEVLAGRTLDELAAAAEQARRGEVAVQHAVAAALGDRLTVSEWRNDERLAIVAGVTGEVRASPWPDLPAGAIAEAQAQPWLLPPVFEKVREGKSELLSELRPAAALFLQFGGLDYETDDAGTQLDAFVRWVQTVVDRHDGAMLQLTLGDKGSYLYVAFGVPVAHDDDAARAVSAALELQSPPAELGFITGVQCGLAYGQMRAGAYGSSAQRAYGAIGDKTNLAARLMQAASPPVERAGQGGSVLCDEAIYQAAQAQWVFDLLPPIAVKGKSEPVAVYRPTGDPASARLAPASLVARAAERALLIDRLSPADQLTLKAASVIGRVFTVDVLRDIFPNESDRGNLAACLQTLEDLDLIQPRTLQPTVTYGFKDPLTHETAYNLMLFAQRRQLHRAIAEWYERTYAGDLPPHYPLLAYHWRRAEDAAKAVYYLEKAGEQARENGDYQEALKYFNESLALDARASVLSAEYHAAGDHDRHSRPNSR